MAREYRPGESPLIGYMRMTSREHVERFAAMQEHMDDLAAAWKANLDAPRATYETSGLYGKARVVKVRFKDGRTMRLRQEDP